MGYAVPKQRGHGLLQRMRSRAFIIGDWNEEEHRIVYVSVDNGMAFQIVKTEVVDRLNKYIHIPHLVEQVAQLLLI